MKIADKVVWIKVSEIKSNSSNPRKSVPNLTNLGYGIFDQLDDKPSLVSLALGDSDKRVEFIKLIDENEPTIRDLASDILANGFINVVNVRPIEDGGYDLVAGCRRTLAALYNSCKTGDEAKVEARIGNETDEEAVYKGFSENAHRIQMNPVEEAEWFLSLKKSGLKVPEISRKTGIDIQTIYNRLKLLELKKLNPKVLERIRVGEIPQSRGLDYIKKVKENKDVEEPDGDTSRRRFPSIKQAEELYVNDETLHEEVRKWIAGLIGLDYIPFSELQEMKRKIQEAQEK